MTSENYSNRNHVGQNRIFTIDSRTKSLKHVLVTLNRKEAENGGHSPSHSHRILLIPSNCAGASLGVSWEISGVEPVSAALLAYRRKHVNGSHSISHPQCRQTSWRPQPFPTFTVIGGGSALAKLAFPSSQILPPLHGALPVFQEGLPFPLHCLSACHLHLYRMFPGTPPPPQGFYRR